MVLPHINPANGTPITRIGNGSLYTFASTVGDPFRTLTTLQSITDFNGNITTVESYTFRDSRLKSISLESVANVGLYSFSPSSATGVLSTALTSVDFPNLETVGSYAFYNARALTSIELEKARNIGNSAFYNTGLKQAIAPELTTLGVGAFQNTQVGSDPDYAQGFYFPLLTNLPSTTFSGAQLTYVNRAEQMPNVTSIGSSSFASNTIAAVDITGVTNVDSSGFQSQRNRAFTSLIAPDLVNVGSNAFYYNALTSLDLPKVETINTSAFSYNTLTEIALPLLTTINGNNAFHTNNLTQVRLPNLRSMTGQGIFGENLLREAYLDNINVDGIGVNTFSTTSFPNSITSPNAKNPGLASLGNYVAVYTNTAGVPSRENYIVNPTTPENSLYNEDDFTWDANDPSMVTGFTNQGKAKMIANNFDVILPPRAKIVSDYAFYNTGMRSVTGSEVVEARLSSFSSNPLSKAVFPKITTIGDNAFNNNKALSAEEKLTNFDFTNVTSVGVGAFQSSGLMGVLDIPLITSISQNAFRDNLITSVNAPELTNIAETYAFYNNRLTSLDKVQFPKLTRIEGASAFSSNPVRSMDLPDLTYSVGNGEFIFSYGGGYPLTEPVIWEQNPAIQMSGTQKNVYSSRTFTFFTPEGKNAQYTMLGGIILTSPRNPDGILNRANPNGFTETEGSGSTYTFNGRSVTAKVRRAVIDPGTVKVNYVIEGGELFDGTGGKPNVPGYTEMIYEELEPRVDATGALATHRKYLAPSIPGYVLVSSTDAGGATMANRNELQVPFQPLGSRTDREVTFTYKKLETNLYPELKLDYVIKPTGSTSAYEHTFRGNSLNNQTIATAFSLNKIGSNLISLENARLVIESDSPYLDYTKTIVANDSSTAVLYDPSGVRLTERGAEISLKNTQNLSAVNDVRVNFAFLGGLSIPDITHANFAIKLVNKVNGVDTVIAEGNHITLGADAKPLKVIADITSVPSLTVGSRPLVTGYNYPNTSDIIDGPRNMGGMTEVDGVYVVGPNPSAVTYSYNLSNINYPIDQYTITHVLPEYTAMEGGQQVTKRAVFDPALNPGWVLSADGTSAVYTGQGNQVSGGYYYSNGSEKYRLPKLALSYPYILEGSPAKSDVFVDIVKTDDPVNSVSEDIERARGDLGIGDSHTIYPIPPVVIVPNGRDYAFGKSHGGTPNLIGGRAIMFDNSSDRSREFHYGLSMSATNETIDMKDVSVIDHGLDERLRYKRVEFTQTAASAKNMSARVTGYRKVGTNIDPQADTQVISRIVPIAPGNSVHLPNDEIDYVKVDMPTTKQEPAIP